MSDSGQGGGQSRGGAKTVLTVRCAQTGSVRNPTPSSCTNVVLCPIHVAVKSLLGLTAAGTTGSRLGGADERWDDVAER